MSRTNSSHATPETGAVEGRRWAILGAIFLLSLTAFVQRLTLPVAAERMMPALGLSQVQIGWLFSAFIIGYTAFQFPGGLVGMRFGARRVLLVSCILGIAMTLALAAAPVITSGAIMLAIMLVSRFLLGMAQAPLYPVSSGVLASWFPATEWAWALSLLVTGIGLGAGITPPIVAWLMQESGWQAAVCLSTVPAAIALILWWRIGKDHPTDKIPDVGAPQQAQRQSAQLWRDALVLMTDRNVLALTVSYVLLNTVVYFINYWSFLYLVQERHFTVLESGMLASAPFLVGAVAAGIGGRICDRCCVRWGARRGVRFVPKIALPSVAVTLYLAVHAANPYWAVVALTACYSGVEMTEGSYWCAAMRVGRERTMAATGVLNTGGNLGGILITPVVAYLSSRQQWATCFMIAAVCACAAAALWLMVDPDRISSKLSTLSRQA